MGPHRGLALVAGRQDQGDTPTEVDQGVGHDDYWQAGVTGTVCGLELTSADAVFMAEVQKSHWVNMTRTPKK